MEDAMSTEPAQAQGPKYLVNLEGGEYAWDRETIRVSEIRTLAGWDASQPIVEVNLDDNTERTLAEDEAVTLKPGHGFAKKVKFQRG
jgi:Multiubiquitin